MSEENKPEELKDKYKDHEVQIKTLFAKLTELILQSIATRKDGVQMIVAVGKWAALTFASIVVMLEKDPKTSFVVIDKFTGSLNQEIKGHATMIRGMKNAASGKEKSRIIIPD